MRNGDRLRGANIVVKNYSHPLEFAKGNARTMMIVN